MRIIAYIAAHGGPNYHRITAPLYQMPGVDVFLTNDPKEEHFAKGCDIFMYNRVIPEAAVPFINQMKDKYGFKVCVDVDDYWHLDPEHILYEEWEKAKYAERQVDHLRRADFVLTTHSRLAEAISEFNRNVEVCPNAIPKIGQFDIEREPHYLTRLFWQGSVTHQRDIAILENPLQKLNTLSSKIKMVMAGFVEEEDAWQEMARIYTAGFKHQYQIIPGAHVAEYYQQYKQADICLVPLVKSRFNSYKSNLKILEAANLGLPVIASQVDPYLDMPLLYAKSGNDWVKHITRLVKSRKRQRDAGYELAWFCQERYDFDKINNKRRQIFEHVATKASA